MSKYRADIDGLRALAIILVVAYHVFPNKVSGGYMGVDIFFVISGYLISGIITNHLRSDDFSFLEFYGRRVRRIFPALITMLVGTTAIGWMILSLDQLHQLFNHVEAGSLFFSNFLLNGEAGYFDGASTEKPLLHLWSLAVEEQFYLIWPLFLVAAWRFRLPTKRLVAVCAIASFGTGLYFAQERFDTTAAFYLPQARFWEMMVGAYLACGDLRLDGDSAARGHHHNNMCALIGATAIFASALFKGTDNSRAILWTLLPTTGTALLIYAGPSAWFNQALLARRFLVSIGLISYPLYLWHWPLLTMLRLGSTETPNVLAELGVIWVSIVLAWITYQFIEKKVRWRTQATRILVPTMAFLGLLSFGASATIYSFAGDDAWLGVATNPAVVAQFTGSTWQYTTNKECLDRYPFPPAKNYRSWFCMVSKSTEPTVLLLGSSFANQLYPGLVRNPSLSHQTIISIGSCHPADVPSFENAQGNSPCVGDRIKANNDFIDSIIVKSKSIRYVIIDGLSTPLQLEYVSHLKNRIDFLEKLGIQVIVFKPHVKPGFHPRACFPRRNARPPRNCTFSPDLLKRMDVDFQPIADMIAQSHPKVLFFDQNALYCQNQVGKCSYVRDGLPLHRDAVHISEYGSIKLAENFVKWLAINAPEMLDPKVVTK